MTLHFPKILWSSAKNNNGLDQVDEKGQYEETSKIGNKPEVIEPAMENSIQYASLIRTGETF